MICRPEKGGCGKEIAFVRVELAYQINLQRMSNHKRYSFRALHVDQMTQSDVPVIPSYQTQLKARTVLEDSCCAANHETYYEPPVVPSQRAVAHKASLQRQRYKNAIKGELSAACARSNHSSCTALRCACPCNHGIPKEL